MTHTFRCRRLVTALLAGVVPLVTIPPASADPIIDLVTVAGGCQRAGDGEATATAKVDGGSSGTLVSVTIKWTYYTDPVQSQTAGCPNHVVHTRSGYCAWKTAYWKKAGCYGPSMQHEQTDGLFECVSPACGTGNRHELLVEVFPNTWKDSRSKISCRAYLLGAAGSGSYTTTLSGKGGGSYTSCTMYRG